MHIEVAMENEQLKQEVAHLTKDLTQVKGKTKPTQPHQDNTIKRVKKLNEEQTMVCYVCHKKATSPMSARWRIREKKRRKRKIKRKQASSPTPIPTRWTKRPPQLISWRRRKIIRWWPSWWTSKPTMEPNTFGCQRRSFPTWRAPRRFGSRKRSEKSDGLREI